MAVAAYMMLLSHRSKLRTDFKLTLITMQYNRIHKQIQQMQSQQAKFENIFSTMLDQSNSFAQSSLQFTMRGTSQAVYGLQAKLSKESDPDERARLKELLEGAQMKANKANRIAYFAFQTQVQQNALAQQIFNSIQDSSNEAKIRELQRKEEMLEHEKQSLELESIMYDEQYKAFKEKAKQDAKETAPGFGLG